MKKIKAALTLSLFALSAVAAENDPRISEIAAVLPEKPGLRFAHISNRARWDSFAATEHGRKAIASAVAAMREPIADLSDALYLEYYRPDCRTDTKYGKNKSKRARALAALVFGECLENKGRFLPKITEYIESMCDETTWVNPGHNKDKGAFTGERPRIDLGSMSTSQGIARSIALLEGLIPESTVKRAKDCCEKQIFSLYRRIMKDPGTPYGGWFRGKHNWNPACHHGVILTAICLLDSRIERARFLVAAADATRNYLDGVPEDGYCTEGTGYWNYGFGNYLKLGLHLRRETGGKLDMFADPRVGKLFNFIYSFPIEIGRTPQFTDGAWGGGANRGTPYILALARQVWPDVCDSSALDSGIFEGGIEAFILRAFGQEPPRGKPTRDVLPIRSMFPVSQIYVLRKDPAAPGKPFGIGLKGGHNDEAHNHNDVGAYSVFAAGYDIAGDPGCKSYTKDSFGPRRYEEDMRSSYGHSVPYPAGRQQKPGKRFSGEVLFTSFTPGKDVVRLDLAPAYGDVPGLKSLVREFTYDRKEGRISVKDEVEFSSPQEFETPIVTYCDMVYSYDRCRFNLISSDRLRSVPVELEVEGGDWEWKVNLLDNTPKVSPKRMAVRFKKPVMKASVTVSYFEKQKGKKK